MNRIGLDRIGAAAFIIAWQLGSFVTLAVAADWPMLGRDGTRNAVSPEIGAPTQWAVEQRDEKDGRVIQPSQGIRWLAPLGSVTQSTPVVSDGLVWIGTNSYQEGGDLNQEVHSVLKCFRVADGKQVYEFDSPKLGPRLHDPGWSGLGSSPLIEGNRLWLATNRSEVLCLDIGPLIRGEGTPRELWKLDLIKAFGIFPHVPLMGPARPCSIGPSWNGRIFVTTNNGVGEDRTTVPKPEAPSLVCLNKDTGELYWKDNSPGINILLSQLASPSVAEIGGQMQIIVPQSDGWLRGFDPLTGKVLWEFDVNPKTSTWIPYGPGARNSLLGNAVVSEDRIYIASGRDVEQGEGTGRLVCIDPTKRGNISSELAVNADGKPLPRRRVQAVDSKAGEMAVPNPNSGLVWEFMSSSPEFEDTLHRTMNSVVVAKGLVIVADAAGLVHCFDAKTGQRYWRYDTFATIWASPLIVDDKIYVGDEDGDVTILGLSSDPNVAMPKVMRDHQPLAEIPMDNSLYAAPIYANGVLYLAQRNRLFAISADQSDEDRKRASGYWPQWRGPNRDNISSEKELLKEWPEAGPPLLWRVDGIGNGIAAVSIADGKIYTLGYFEAGEFLSALDQRTGERLWVARLGPKVNESPRMRWLSQRSPTLDGDRLYTITADGRLVCLQTRDGQELWSKNYPEEFASRRPSWGFCDYPLVDNDRLICTPGSEQASVVALDKMTGKEIWRTLVPDGGRITYAVLVVAEIEGERQYITFLSKTLIGLRASDGQLLWTNNRVGNRTANSHTPLVLGDQLLVSSGYGSGQTLLKLKTEGKTVAVEEQYHQNHNLNAFQDSALVVGDHLYCSSISALMCLHWKSGQKVWQTAMGRHAMTWAEGRLYVRESEGRVTLAEASPTEYIPKGSFQIPEAVNAQGATTPVIAGGRLYLRDNNKLLCYDIRESAFKQVPIPPRTVVLPTPSVVESINLPRDRRLRSVFVPTPQDIVVKMLKLAEVKKTDILYDLGSGDGRIVITAAKDHGCRAIGYELDKELVTSSRAQAEAAGVSSLVDIEFKDLFTANLGDADVVAVYLLPQQLEKLLPQLKKLKPGARIISHQFEIPGVKADRKVTMKSAVDGESHTLYLWTTPVKESQPTVPKAE